MTQPWGNDFAPPPPVWNQWRPKTPEDLHAQRKRALVEGIVSLLLLPFAATLFVVGLLSLLFLVGVLILPVSVLCVPFAVGLAIGSIVRVRRNRMSLGRDLLLMLPAFVTIGLVATYVVLVGIDVLQGG